MIPKPEKLTKKPVVPVGLKFSKHAKITKN